MRAVMTIAALLLAGCAQSRPPAPAVAAPIAAPEDAVWLLASIDGAPTASDARMTFVAGSINGQGPCNSIRGRYERDGTAFSTIGLVTTQLDCPGLDEETGLLNGLLAARKAEVSGRALTMSSEIGPTLVFIAENG